VPSASHGIHHATTIRTTGDSRQGLQAGAAWAAISRKVPAKKCRWKGGTLAVLAVAGDVGVPIRTFTDHERADVRGESL
jgi:hypothetical protein